MSNRIDEATVRHIANLARLKLTDAEVSRFGAQLSDIVIHIEQLSAVNTEGVEPTAHPLPVSNVLREDVPVESLSVERVLANAPDSAPPYFKLPKVLDQMDA